MKRKQLLTKVLLAVAMLGVGTSAWADDVASYNFNSQTTPFTISDAARLSASYAEHVTNGGDYYVKYTCGNMNAVAFAYYDFSSSVSDAATVTIDFDFYIPEVAGHELISIADASAHTASGGGFTNKSNTGYGSTGAIFNLGCFRGGGNNKFAINSTQNNYAGLGAWCHASVTVDNATKKVSYEITKEGSALASASDVAFLSASANRCSQIDLYIGTNTNGNAIQIDNLVITKTVSAASHNYTINAMAGSTKLQELATGIANENAGYSVSVPKVIVSDGKYYVLDSGQAGMTLCLAEYTMGTADEVKEINYTLDESVIYFKECETIQQSTASSTSSSGYTCGYYATPQVVTITETGIYQLEVNITGRDSNSSLDVYTENGTEAVATFAKNSGTGIKTLEFFAAGNMRIGGPYYNDKFNNSKGVDYLIVRKIATSVPATITSAGWATLYTPYALDFSSVTGLTAYTAAVADNKVTLTEVTDVPAGTGVVLKGDADTYNIPVAASSATAKGDLLGSATDATSYNAYADNTLYMLKKVGEKAQFVPVTSGSIAAGKAYLKIAAATARNLDVTFADEATGISAALMNKETMNNEVYNLKGQRVAAPMKGLYIVNGKKMVIK